MREKRLLLPQLCAALVAVAGACSNDAGVAGGPNLGAGAGVAAAGTVATPTPTGASGTPGTATGTAGTGAAAAGTGAPQPPTTGAAGSAPVATGGTGAATAGAGPVTTAGTGGAVGGGAAGTAAPTAGTGAPVAGEGAAGGGAPMTGVKPQCLAKDSQMVVLGDSYVDWPSHSFLQDLAMQLGHRFRSYAVGGVSMATGGIDPSNNVPQQYAKAVRADKDIRFIVMDGGGNDILVPDALMFARGGDCKNSGAPESIPDCKKILDLAVEAATKLINQAATDGVRDVIYFYYPDVPKGTLLGGLDPVAVLNFARPAAKGSCDNAEMTSGGKTRCHWVEMTDVFTGHPEWFAAADIHPTPQGSAAMAKKIADVMKEKCLAQPMGTPCCEP